MLGHLRLGQTEQSHEVVDRALPVGEDVQDLPPPGLGHRVERVCCRRCSCHAEQYIPISEYVKVELPATVLPMGDMAPRSGGPPSRRKREQRAFQLVVVGGVSSAVAVIGVVLALIGVIGFGIPVLALIIAAVSALLFRRTVSA